MTCKNRRNYKTLETLETRSLLDNHLVGALADVTQKIADLDAADQSADSPTAQITSFTEKDDKLYLLIGRGSTGQEPGGELQLWTTDGYETTTKIADVEDRDVSGFSQHQMVAVGDSVHFFAARVDGPNSVETTTFADLYRSNGTSEGTTLVSTLFNGFSPGSSDLDFSLEPLDDERFIARVAEFNTGSVASGLWISDGTETGTLPVTPKFNFSFGPAISDRVILDGKVLFGGGFSSTGNGLDFPGLFSLDPSSMTVEKIRGFRDAEIFGVLGATDLVLLGDHAYFRANDGETGFELWRSDGTEEGTTLVADLHPSTSGNTGMPGSNPLHLTNVGGTLFFFATTEEHGRELWKSDGTPEGTVLVRDITSGTGSTPFGSLFASPTEFRNSASAGGLFYFVTRVGTRSLSLWRSDGTGEGTFSVADFTRGEGGDLRLTQTTELDGRLVFSVSGTNSTIRNQIWMSDGTEEGTEMIVGFEAKNVANSPTRFAMMGNEIVFASLDALGANSLWAVNVPTNLKADIDNSGVVDFQDFLILSENFRKEVDGGRADGDLDGNGIVDFSDFLTLARTFHRDSA